MSGNRYAALDDKILTSIDKIRDEVGSCTLAQLAARTRMSKDAVRHRCQALKAQGKVTWTPNIAGTLRRIQDRQQRLYELLVQRAVEDAAVGDDTDLDEMVWRWANSVLGMAVATAWPELIPEAERESPGEATEPDPGRDPGTAPDPDGDGGGTSTRPEFRCEPCDRTFAHQGALNGHLTSKAHAAMTRTVPAG